MEVDIFILTVTALKNRISLGFTQMYTMMTLFLNIEMDITFLKAL